jgi:tetratricopeptide (TPR) repeat protein/predicted Ser/Thr protein kinase
MDVDKPDGKGDKSPKTATTTATSELERGSSVGRYLILGLLGKGGMGEVYAAYDPELNRKIALKLLRANTIADGDPSEGRARLLREAQAIARLSDPNVVVVFDVGTFADRVFLAMEFVDGNTLGYWTQAKPRSWREVVEVFKAAGRGLASAHKAGLVHRDFKPDNVMIGRDGQIRVMDFGLARAIEVEGNAGLSSADDTPTRDLARAAAGVATDAVASTVDFPLTLSGTMMGTPAYMAPEQFRSATVDARTDQFSFCVAVYEALYGERPFEGRGIHELTANVLAGRVREPPTRARVPGWLRKVIVRGLRPDRAQRHTSMEALLAELERDPARVRRRWAVSGSAVAIIALLGVGLFRAQRQQRMRCLGADAKLAGIWELPSKNGLSPRKEAIRTAFMATGKRYAADSFTVVSNALDRYVTDWNNMHRDSCQATHTRGEQSAEVLDLRTSCLRDRFDELRALTNVFSDANGEVVSKAVAGTQSLRPIEQCADIVTLRAVVRPPDDKAVRSAVDDVRTRLADVKALASAGKYKKAMGQIGQIVEAAQKTTYQPVVAESLFRLAELQVFTDEGAKAEENLERAVWMADGSRHDEVVAAAAAELVFVVGYTQGRYADGERWARHALAALHRLGGGHDVVAGWRANNLGAMYEKEGRFEESLAANLEAVTLKSRALGGAHFDVGISYCNVASSLFHLGRVDEAIDRNQQALKILRAALGPEHPQVGIALLNEADFLNRKGRFAEARAAAKEAVAIWERESDADHPFLGYALTAIGESLVDDGQPAQAIPYLERAIRIRETRDPEADLLGETRFALARALWESNTGLIRAMSLAEKARSDYQGSRVAEKQRADIDAWINVHSPRVQRTGVR